MLGDVLGEHQSIINTNNTLEVVITHMLHVARSAAKSGRASGGVSVFIRKNIQFNILEMVNTPECIIILSIGDKDLLLVATYITPRRVAYHEACYTFISEKNKMVETTRKS